MKMNILNKAMAAGNTPAYKRKAFQDVADVAASVGSKHIEARAEYMAGIETRGCVRERRKHFLKR